MEKRQLSLWLHPVFLVCLALLLLNDHYLKYEWHNAFTGKLSDVMGLVVISIFFRAIFPAKEKLILLIVALFFVWWKSPLSNNIIAFLNESLHIPVTRVVDDTDLYALIVLPFLHFIQPPVIYSAGFMHFVKASIGIVSVFAICATSMPPRLYHPEPGHMEFDKSYKTRLSEEGIFQKLDSMQIRYRVDSMENMQAYNNRGLYWKIRNADSSFRWEKFPVQKDSTLYYRYNVAPFYVVDTLNLGSDILYNVRFRVTNLGRKRKIELMSARLPGRNDTDLIPGELYKQYRKMLKTFLIE